MTLIDFQWRNDMNHLLSVWMLYDDMVIDIVNDIVPSECSYGTP